MKKCDLVFHYHDQTKHDYYRYAASLGHLDWDNQPDPFRRFIGSRLISLPLTEVNPSLEYDQLYSQKIQAHPVSVETISALFFYSLALSTTPIQTQYGVPIHAPLECNGKLPEGNISL